MKNPNFQVIQDLKSLIKDIDTQNREKQKQLEQQIDHQKYEIQKTFDMYNNKLKECENLTIQRNNAEIIQKRIQDDNDKLIEKLNHFGQEKILEIDELRHKMDSGSAYQSENLKSAYNTQVGMLSDQIADLQNQLAIKNKEFTEMMIRLFYLKPQYQEPITVELVFLLNYQQINPSMMLYLSLNFEIVQYKDIDIIIILNKTYCLLVFHKMFHLNKRRIYYTIISFLQNIRKYIMIHPLFSIPLDHQAAYQYGNETIQKIK